VAAQVTPSSQKSRGDIDNNPEGDDIRLNNRNMILNFGDQQVEDDEDNKK
jgi:hypothetical protein